MAARTSMPRTELPETRKARGRMDMTCTYVQKAISLHPAEAERSGKQNIPSILTGHSAITMMVVCHSTEALKYTAEKKKEGSTVSCRRTMASNGGNADNDFFQGTRTHASISNMKPESPYHLTPSSIGKIYHNVFTKFHLQKSFFIKIMTFQCSFFGVY